MRLDDLAGELRSRLVEAWAVAASVQCDAVSRSDR